MPPKKKEEAEPRPKADESAVEDRESKPRRRAPRKVTGEAPEAKAVGREEKPRRAGKAASMEEPAKKRSARPRKAAKPAAEVAEPAAGISADIGFQFRPADAPKQRDRQPEAGRRPERGRRKPEAPAATQAQSSKPARPSRAPRPKPAPKPAPVETKVPIPQKPVYERIKTPEGAPRVILRDGRPTIVADGKALPPFMFFGNPADEARSKTVLDEIRKAAQAGVHIHSLMVELAVEKELAQSALDLSAYLIDQVLKADPDGYVIFRVVIAGAPGWERNYPDAVFRLADGTIAEPSFSDENFWTDAADFLSAFVKGLRKHTRSDRILGLHLDRGEWFFAQDWGYDTSKAAEMAFRDWAIGRYSGDRVSLQSAWFDGSVRFEALRIPDYDQYPLSGEGFLRARRKERKWVDYHLFLSDAIVERIQHLAWTTKKASEGWFLVAVSYGYTFEWAHPASGHLSLGKLLRTHEVDIIGGPPSYKDRDLGGAAAFPCPIDSVALNGKLYISEEDFKTPISKGPEPDEFNPVMETPQALEAAHWRGLGCALAHASGIAWMDLWGNGWLNTPAIWQRASKVRDALIMAMGAPVEDPDVAVLIDERSLAYLSDGRAFKQIVQDAREAVLRAGVSAGFYLLTDLAHRTRFPEAKLYIFLNAWDLRPEVRMAIKNRLQRDGKTLFWAYSAGLFEAGREALERVREVTGIAIRPQPFNSSAGTTILNRKHQLTELLEEKALSTVEQLEPSYFAIPEEGTTILGEYTQTGLPSFVVREVKAEDDPKSHWRSVFLGEPLITERIIRGLCAVAGVPVWNYHGDVVHARRPFLGIHYSGSGHRIATLPDRWDAHDLIKDKPVGADLTHVKSEATDGASQVFVVGEEAEVQGVLSIDREAVLHVDELPEQEEDGPGVEDTEHDVPIMKLPISEEFADMFGEEPEEEETAEPERAPSKRRTRRPRRAKPQAQPTEDAEAGISVMFRDVG